MTPECVSWRYSEVLTNAHRKYAAAAAATFAPLQFSQSHVFLIQHCIIIIMLSMRLGNLCSPTRSYYSYSIVQFMSSHTITHYYTKWKSLEIPGGGGFALLACVGCTYLQLICKNVNRAMETWLSHSVDFPPIFRHLLVMSKTIFW